MDRGVGGGGGGGEAMVEDVIFKNFLTIMVKNMDLQNFVDFPYKQMFSDLLNVLTCSNLSSGTEQLV